MCFPFSPEGSPCITNEIDIILSYILYFDYWEIVPGILFRRDSQPSIHFPNSVNADAINSGVSLCQTSLGHVRLMTCCITWTLLPIGKWHILHLQEIMGWSKPLICGKNHLKATDFEWAEQPYSDIAAALQNLDLWILYTEPHHKTLTFVMCCTQRTLSDIYDSNIMLTFHTVSGQNDQS